MRRELHSFVLPLLFAAACSSGPAVQADGAMDFAPAPLGETAMPSAARAGDVADRGAVVFRMSDAIEFACKDRMGRRVELSFRVSYAVQADRAAEAQGLAHANLPVAIEQAMRVCEGVDFHDDDCVLDCEHKLMGRVGEAMFGAGASVAQVTRIAWSRVLFR